MDEAAATGIYTLSLHDALPIWLWYLVTGRPAALFPTVVMASVGCALVVAKHHENIRRMREGTESRFEGSGAKPAERSEEHTSELQSQSKLVCRLLLEKKN